MKRLLAACMVLLLASCIEVDDFGDAWDKTTIDPTFAGRWEKISEVDEKPTGQSWTFTVKDGAYEVQTFIRGKLDDDGPISPVKSLTVGPYTFLAKGPEEGTILRYTIDGDRVIFYVLNSQAAWTFIQAKFPEQDSFYRGDPDDESDDPENVGDPVRIRVLNSETVKILSSIPDSDPYWEPDTLVRKIK